MSCGGFALSLLKCLFWDFASRAVPSESVLEGFGILRFGLSGLAVFECF